jgi:YHS domain-containing protein
MLPLRYSPWLLPLLLAVPVVAADQPKQLSPKEALQNFNDLIGTWRGTGIPAVKPQQGFWIETQDWAWRFKDNDAWLVVHFTDSKFYKKGELKYRPAKDEYELKLTTVDKKEIVFTGKFQDKKLILQGKNEDVKEEQKLVMQVLHSNRYLYSYHTLPEGKTFWNQVYKVGVTKEGVPFAVGDGKPECIVSGGAGTMTVSYQGQTYYVCCSGCRDEFVANPVKYIAEYEKKLKEKKK